MNNTIIAIGFLGDKTCYLNVPEKEAIQRYIKSEDLEITSVEQFKEEYSVRTYIVSDEFCVYDIWV